MHRDFTLGWLVISRCQATQPIHLLCNSPSFENAAQRGFERFVGCRDGVLYKDTRTRWTVRTMWICV